MYITKNLGKSIMRLFLTVVNTKDRVLYCLMLHADNKVTLSDYYDIK